MWAWQFAKAQQVAERNGWTKFVTMQNHYNLVYREEEREMLPLCLDQGVGVIPWSPLARGLLTRDHDAATARRETDEFGKTLYGTANVEIVDQLAQIAAQQGEVVFIVHTANLAQAVNRGFIVHMADQGVAGIGRNGHHAALG